MHRSTEVRLPRSAWRGAWYLHDYLGLITEALQMEQIRSHTAEQCRAGGGGGVGRLGGKDQPQ